MRPGFFFFLPSPKVLCPEVLAVAMPEVAELWVGLTSLAVSSVVSSFRPVHSVQHPALLLLQCGLQLFFEGVVLSVPGHHGT